MTTGLLMPSRLNSASYLPGPHELSTALTAGGRTGERATIAPTFRSRFGSPSSRRPTPGATELSTVEWHRAHVMPSRLMCRSAVTWASTPTTASRRSRSTVVAALVRSAPARKPGGSGAASTLRPSASAVAGDTPVSITSFKCSGVGPERLVAKGPVSKDVLALRGNVHRRTRDEISGGRERATRGRDGVRAFTAGEQERHERDQTHTTS